MILWGILPSFKLNYDVSIFEPPPFRQSACHIVRWLHHLQKCPVSYKTPQDNTLELRLVPLPHSWLTSKLSLVKIRLHTENQLPGFPGCANYGLLYMDHENVRGESTKNSLRFSLQCESYYHICVLVSHRYNR